jgi:hypothetical protein
VSRVFRGFSKAKESSEYNRIRNEVHGSAQPAPSYSENGQFITKVFAANQMFVNCRMLPVGPGGSYDWINVKVQRHRCSDSNRNHFGGFELM